MVNDGLNDVVGANSIHYTSITNETDMASTMEFQSETILITFLTLDSYDGTDFTNDIQEQVGVVITGLDAVILM